MKLKSCPFCGNEAITFEPDADRNIVSCKLGHAPMRTIEGWNTRTDPMRKQIEQLIADVDTRAVSVAVLDEYGWESRREELVWIYDRLRAILASPDAVSAEKGADGSL